MGSNHAVVRVSNVVKSFQAGEVAVQALRGISLEIQRGEFVAIIGQWQVNYDGTYRRTRYTR